jgi:hypothetical protein
VADLEHCKPMTSWSRWGITPGFYEASILSLFTGILFVSTIAVFQKYSDAVTGFGDNAAYSSVASAIRAWDFRGIEVKQFWGFSYAIALVSRITSISVQNSLISVCVVSSLLSIALANKLWGGWVAALFAVLNFEWMQRSFLGGSEPLFVVLLFAFFLAARKQSWLIAGLLGSLATITRPVGLLAIAVLGFVLLKQRKYSEFSLCATVALIVGALYILPFWIFFHDPLYEFHQYKASDWSSESPIGLPFGAIIPSLFHSDSPWTNVALNCGWLGLVLIGFIVLVSRRSQPYASQQPVEFWFCVAYVAFLFTYNSPKWALAEFPRFAIPVLPMMFIALDRWFPHDRRIFWALGIVSPVLAAASALGIRNVEHLLVK